jgi:hypothetical protein
VNLVWLRRLKIAYSLSYVDYRPKMNAGILLDIGHTVKGDHTWEGKGKGRKPKT